MELHDLRDALVHELNGQYSAGTQLTKALPKMAKTAEDPSLRDATVPY